MRSGGTGGGDRAGGPRRLRASPCCLASSGGSSAARRAEWNTTADAEALRASEARIRDFAEMSSDWFWEQDADLRFTWISDGATSGYGHGREYRGKTRWELANGDLNTTILA